MILPGPLQDADYNAVGYQALQDLKKRRGASVSFSENVAVADAERVAREYISSGSTVLCFHGGQFVSIVSKLATEFQKVEFVQESSGRQPSLPANVWNIGRKFYQGFYVLGVLAAASTKSNKIGYIAGVRLPDFVAALNAVKLAAQRTKPSATVEYAFTGDQNDQVKARETAASQINDGVDFIVVSVNNGVYGVVQAAKAAPGRTVVTTHLLHRQEQDGTRHLHHQPALRLQQGLPGGDRRHRKGPEGRLRRDAAGERLRPVADRQRARAGQPEGAANVLGRRR